jgi:signal transduction histidine kinase
MLCAYASNPQERGQYATRYLNTILGYSNIPEMRKRPYAVNKRQLLSAYSNLAISAEAIGKDLATSYYRKFMNLLKTYPESASAAPEYELYYTSSNYYLGIKDYKKFIEFSDSLINFSKQIPLYKEHVIAYVSAKAAAYDSLRMYKEAYETSKEYAVLLDTLRMQELRKKMENLEIEKGANELVIEKRSLELELQKSKKENYLYISLLLLALCAVFYIFFRLGKMRSLYRALQKSNELVLIANQKAQESEEMKTAFIRNMSHEIRTPLNAINGFSELITNDDISMDEKQAFSRIIYENCYHLTSMLNNLLEIAQLDSGNDSLPLVPTRIHELCLHEMQQVKKYQEKPEINYVVEGDKENDMILTNRAYFSLIISHLLANANKFTEKGSITLSYHLDSGANLVTLSVTDTGCGIPQDKQEWIFERFTKTNDFIPGSGLGLYLCRLIVNRLNGKIKTDPSYTKGSRFVITMPIATPSKPSEPTD